MKKFCIIAVCLMITSLVALAFFAVAQNDGDGLGAIFSAIVSGNVQQSAIDKFDADGDGELDILDAIEHQRKKNMVWDKTKPIKILTIGNSFSQDVTAYMHPILKDLGACEVVIGNAYIGGCTLERHYNNLKADIDDYIAGVEDGGAKEYIYYKSNSATGEMVNHKSNTTLLEIVQDEDWDFISLQQGSAVSGMPNSYQPYLSNLINCIETYRTNENAKFVWHMTWAYQSDYTSTAFNGNYHKDQMYMYGEIVNAVKTQVRTLGKFSIIVPSGTAIQNMRTGWLGDNLTRDGLHLSIPVGRYVTALTFVGAVTGWDINDVNYAPSTEIAGPTKLYIKESVNNALNKKYAVTQSTYIEDPYEFDFDNDYELFDWEATYGEFWQSSSAAHPTERYNASNLTSSTLYNNYVASGRMFTKEDLPNGTVIVIDSGYRYRREKWITLEKQLNREDQTYQQYVIVDDDWWGEYNYTAFNISKSTGGDISAMYEEVASHFRIYIPRPYNFSKDYTEFDWEATYGEFWQSDNTAHPTERYNASNLTNSTFYKNYVASGRMFTKDDLPNGTVIVLDNGYRYRREKWITLERQPNREGQTYQQYTVVDDDWWGEFNYVAFNISRSTGGDISDIYAEAASHFRIYIPK